MEIVQTRENLKSGKKKQTRKRMKRNEKKTNST